MKITNLLLAGLAMVGVACSSSEKETPNGFKFTVLTKGTGELAKPGQLLMVDFIFKDSKDSVWNDSYKAGSPAPVMINDSSAMATEFGIMQMFRMLSPGDSVACSMPVKKFFEEIAGGPVPPNVDSTLVMTYNFKIHEITEVQAYQAKQQQMMIENQAKQLGTDIAIIDKYLEEKGIVAEKLESGLRYVTTQKGKGENGKTSQSAKVNYIGYTMEGAYFDTNVKKLAQERGLYNPAREPYEPYEVIIDQSQVIRGWHEALKVMSKGSKITVYIPSPLAYGPGGRGPQIGENEILVFDIEMVDLK